MGPQGNKGVGVKFPAVQSWGGIEKGKKRGSAILLKEGKMGGGANGLAGKKGKKNEGSRSDKRAGD